MGVGAFIDGAIAPFFPRAALSRANARSRFEAGRQYEAAVRDQRTKGWKRPSTSADAENWRSLPGLRNGARDLVRNSPYANAAVRQVTANLVGDGVAPVFSHRNKRIAAKAQDGWKRWAEEPVDGFDDFYGCEKVATRGMVEGGESLVAWRPDAGGPDGRIEVLEGDFLDETKMSAWVNGYRDVQGVRTDRNGDRVGYWLRDGHPGDAFASTKWTSELAPAAHVDHVFERLRAGQTRGVSWLAAVALTLRDISDIQDAFRLKKKVEACFSVFITSNGSDDNGAPISAEVTQGQNGGPSQQALRPGMVATLRDGQDIKFAAPTSTGDTLPMIRQALAGVSAVMAPYHLITGDVSQANYSSLRAANLGHWAMLDDWQQNVIVPRLVKPAVRRRMRRMALELGEPRILQCGVSYVFPVRRAVDPVKDLMAEVIEVRAGLKLLSSALAERGINAEDHLRQIAEMNKVIDTLELVLEVDPRSVTDGGILQTVAPFLMGQTGGEPALAIGQSQD